MLCAVAFLAAAHAQIGTPPADMTICTYLSSNQGRNRDQWIKQTCSNNVEDHFVPNFIEMGFNSTTEIITKR